MVRYEKRGCIEGGKVLLFKLRAASRNNLNAIKDSRAKMK